MFSFVTPLWECRQDLKYKSREVAVFWCFEGLPWLKSGHRLGTEHAHEMMVFYYIDLFKEGTPRWEMHPGLVTSYYKHVVSLHKHIYIYIIYYMHCFFFV